MASAPGSAAVRARAAATQAVPVGTAGEVDQQTGQGGVVYGVTVTRLDGPRWRFAWTRTSTCWTLSRPVITTTTTATTDDGPVEG